ncbi:hypothetical protein BRETT_004039 [Brettanomyces bruxellensis]|uniref:Major facilitator superfamily (MFS) profile domain-containing protein n=1 Tax=Dekkera bruxellensis TaxID=5007 RepID=A0A871R516_DEKBR|nr:uncharacterized protein BRETT_004039 [Brettanomyces bruxellensis]QOU19884.1 hypothetical protein BRETT_004039 [Brettanomyces bruxellensis]
MTQFDSEEESKRESIKSGANVKEKTEVGDSILENASREKEVDLDLENLSNNGKPIINRDVDKAMEIAVEIDSISLNEKQDKKLYWKVNLYLLPLICFLYACQYMDKVTSSYAAIMGIRTYYNMHGDMYSWLGTAFYLGYLFFVFPATLLLQKYSLSKVTSLFIVLWGALLCLHAVPKSYAGLITLRVLLGICESIITPAMVIITSQWYKREEQMFVTAIWFSCNGLGTIMGGAIAYGLAIHTNSYSITSWKILFIVTGLMTIVVGIAFYLHMPDDPSKAWFLSKEEKQRVVLRIRSNEQGFGNPHFKKSQFEEALKDLQTWMFVVLSFAAQVPNGGMTNFGSILLNEDFGYSSEESLLMNLPSGAIDIVGCIGLAAFNKRFPRLLIAVFALAITLMGACLLAFASSNSAKLAGYYIYNFLPITMICSLSCFASNTAGHTKKITTNSLYLIAYCVGNLVGPQTFISSQAPDYSGGKISIVVCLCAALLLTIGIYFIYWNRNRRRDAGKNSSDVLTSVSIMKNRQFADLTDKENPYFRYSL